MIDTSLPHPRARRTAIANWAMLAKGSHPCQVPQRRFDMNFV